MGSRASRTGEIDMFNEAIVIMSYNDWYFTTIENNCT